MQIFSVILFALSIGGCASLNIKRSVLTVENDITQTAASLTILHNRLAAFPSSGGSLVQALAIHTAATVLVSNFTKTTTDIATLPVVLSEADGSTISQEVLAMGPLLIDVLVSYAAKKPSFAALPIGGIPALVLQDLNQLRAAVDQFLTALIRVLPSDLIGPIEQLKERIDGSFAIAIQAYS